MDLKLGRVKKALLIALGLLSLLLGILGIFLPLLPTTPFLLLSAACFARSSERFYQWLMNHPRLGPPIRDWRERRVIRLSAKILATVMVMPGAYLFWVREGFPLAVKAGFSLFLALLLLFIWTKPSR